MRIEKSVCLFALICALLLSSCSYGNESGETAVSVTAAVTAEETSAAAVISETSETAVSAEESTITETETETAAASETSEETSSEADTETSAESTEETEITAEETSAETTETTETSGTAAETLPVTTAAKPPAEVVIPEIKMPSSPGTDVISGEGCEIDHSNSSEGYISAVYTGQSPAAKIRIECNGVQYNHDLSTGGKREYFPLMGSGDYTVSVYEQFSGKKYALIASGDFSVTIKSSTGMYLYPNKYVDFDGGSACVKKAAELCAGLSGDVEKIAAIFMFITDSVSYDKQLAATVKSGYVPDPDATLSSKTGICYDYASLLAAMCRSQGIPARLVIGYAEPDIYHAWNEVYTDETGWITPELFLKNKGYNIADATFYAGNTDKDRISEYISDDGNYSAVYRY